MEKVDVYNKLHELKFYKKERKTLIKGEYRLSVFTWILNDNNEILIQQRTKDTKKLPNMWGASSAGGALENETNVETAIRETKEEIGVNLIKDDLTFIGSYTRYNDFVEVFITKKNVDIKDLVLQTEEVQDVKWVTIKEFENMLDNKTSIRSGYDILKLYLDGGFYE